MCLEACPHPSTPRSIHPPHFHAIRGIWALEFSSHVYYGSLRNVRLMAFFLLIFGSSPIMGGPRILRDHTLVNKFGGDERDQACERPTKSATTSWLTSCLLCSSSSILHGKYLGAAVQDFTMGQIKSAVRKWFVWVMGTASARNRPSLVFPTSKNCRAQAVVQ